MAGKCGCSGQVCACFVQGDGITTAVTGVGSATSPYVITALGTSETTVSDSPTLDLAISGAGTTVSPYDISGTVLISANAGNNIISEPDGLFVPTGAATVSVACGLSGDGSAGSPLAVTTTGATFQQEDLLFGATFAPVSIPNDGSTNVTISSSPLISYTNNSPCYSLSLIITAEWDMGMSVPAGGVAVMRIDDADDYIQYANTGSSTADGIHWQVPRMYSFDIAPSTTVTFSTSVQCRSGLVAGVTVNRTQLRVHALGAVKL